MTLSEAISIIDYGVLSTEEEYIAALSVFFGDLFGVTIMNEDGSYRPLYLVLEEASESYDKWEGTT